MEADRKRSTMAVKSVAADKRKLRIVEGNGGAKPKAVVDSPPPQQPLPEYGMQVQVSIIESDALVELQCPYREGLLLDVMQRLRELRVEITTVQSSLTNGVFVAELRAKVKENANGKKASIVEVKRAIHRIIPQC
uniref:Plant bHLH transcription factor ACT-like domain-containing protein n=1 Tax=Davidia involucrata TaxID=16924 RepID=A0A5B7B8H5_DAVIN